MFPTSVVLSLALLGCGPAHESVSLEQAPSSMARALTITDGHLQLDVIGNLEAYDGPLRGSVAVHFNHSGTKESGWEDAIRALEAEQGIVSVDAAAVIRVGDGK